MSPATVKFPLVSNLNNVVEPFLLIKSAPSNSKFQSFDAWSIESEFAFKFASTSTVPAIVVFPVEAATCKLIGIIHQSLQ